MRLALTAIALTAAGSGAYFVVDQKSAESAFTTLGEFEELLIGSPSNQNDGTPNSYAPNEQFAKDFNSDFAKLKFERFQALRSTDSISERYKMREQWLVDDIEYCTRISDFTEGGINPQCREAYLQQKSQLDARSNFARISNPQEPLLVKDSEMTSPIGEFNDLKLQRSELDARGYRNARDLPVPEGVVAPDRPITPFSEWRVHPKFESTAIPVLENLGCQLSESIPGLREAALGLTNGIVAVLECQGISVKVTESDGSLLQNNGRQASFIPEYMRNIQIEGGIAKGQYKVSQERRFSNRYHYINGDRLIILSFLVVMATTQKTLVLRLD